MSSLKHNQNRAAINRIRRWLKENGVATNGLKHANMIRLFGYVRGLDVPVGRKSMKKWILGLYLSGSLDDCVPDGAFYRSLPWKRLREVIFGKYGRVCMKCGSCENIEVDHIFPRSKYPHLELTEDNMQVLCMTCNIWKSNRYIIDYRPKLKTA